MNHINTGGHIQRRLSQKQQQANEQYEQQMEQQRAAARAELEAQRAVCALCDGDNEYLISPPSQQYPVRLQARVLPTTPDETVDYLLQTDASEMEFEVARCKPMLTADFMQHLERCISMWMWLGYVVVTQYDILTSNATHLLQPQSGCHPHPTMSA